MSIVLPQPYSKASSFLIRNNIIDGMKFEVSSLSLKTVILMCLNRSLFIFELPRVLIFPIYFTLYKTFESSYYGMKLDISSLTLGQ